MSLIDCKCTNCGSNLSVNSDKDAAICEYCGSAFVVEKAINSYNISNNISAEVVNVYTDDFKDFVIRAGELVKYNGMESDVIIPDTVTHIGKRVFKNCVGLKSVTLSNSVTTICEEAFKNCSGLIRIEIPDTVTSIEACAFEGCSALSYIKLPDKIERVKFGMFRGCKSLKEIVIPDSVVSIGGEVFEFCYSLTDIKFPKGLKFLGADVFYLCSSLTKVSLPDTVESIGLNEGGGLYSGSFTNSSITEFTIPKGVTKVLPNTFEGCDELFSLTIHDGVTEFSEKALYGCVNLKVICASEEWKKQHWQIHPLLSSYEPKKKNGCYIATAVYGSYDCPQVWALRRYRDLSLNSVWYGRRFIKLYYAISPYLVEKFGDRVWFKRICKNILDKIIVRLDEKGFSQEPYIDRNY